MMNTHYDRILAAVAKEANLYAADHAKLRQFIAGYLEAIAFTDAAEETDDLYGLDLTTEGPNGWGERELKRMMWEAAKFMREARRVVARRVGLGDLWADGVGYTTERLAHDFWLTRNGHGAGFWDRQFTYGEGGYIIPKLGDELTTLATSYGEREAYKGDDGRAYLT